MRRILAIICVLTALVGIGFSAIQRPQQKREVIEKPAGYLAQQVPAQIGNMTSQDKPLGDTEEVNKAAEQVLEVSQFMHRIYKLPNGLDFTLYISYWGVNKLDIAAASRHTPDRCWVMCGWKNILEKAEQNHPVNANGKPLMDAYARQYSLSDDFRTYKRNVWFWHIVDGQRYDYKSVNNYSPNPIVYVKNMIDNAAKGSPEQFFIRIDSDYPIDELAKTPEFNSLLDRLGQMILYKKEAKND